MSKKRKIFLVALGLALLSVLAYATVSTTTFWKIVRENTLFINDVGITGPLYIDGATDITGALTITGAVSSSSDLTLENGEIIDNGTDGYIKAIYNDDAALLGEWRFDSSNTSTANSDYYRLAWYMYDDHAASVKIANIEAICDDVVSSSTDATLRFGVITADTFAAELDLTGADLSPYANAGLDLGSSSYKWGALYITSFGANWTNAGRTVADAGTLTTADINGGTIDGVAIGGASASTGAFTTVTASTSIKVGANGSTVSQINCGTTTIDAGTTGTTVSLTGCTASTRVFVCPVGDTGSAASFKATPGSGSFIVKSNADPSSVGVVVNWFAIK